ncbi:MAG: hypothetical protein ACNA8W_09305 [Bradymonadaceae bacterium]
MQKNLAIEPEIEVLLGTVIPSIDGIFAHGRNPRTLHIALGAGTDAMNARFAIRDRELIDKAKFGNISPSETHELTDQDRETVIRWIARRYTRPAFPDAFNERLRQADGSLIKLSKATCSQPVTAIYIDLDPPFEELEDEQPYRVFVWFAYRDRDRLADIDKLEQEFLKILESCDGIEVREDECGAKHHSDITLEDLELLRPFNYDFRSLATKPGGDMVRDVP